MIGSYIKTARRNLVRDKLFSFINVVGLAISMSVGLLLIAFVLDLRSYDKFHQNGERIYRITNVLTANREQNGKFATTSIKTEKLMDKIVVGKSLRQSEGAWLRGTSHASRCALGTWRASPGGDLVGVFQLHQSVNGTGHAQTIRAVRRNPVDVLKSE